MSTSWNPPRGAAGDLRRRRLLAGAIGAALALASAGAACADQPPLKQVYVFGDSLSDSGAYASAAPPGAGKFTTNPDPVWVELVASGLGLPALTSSAAGGTNYAEGGARVSGGGVHPDIAPFTRTPVDIQVSDYLAGGGTFDAHSLVMIEGGAEDVFETPSTGGAYTAADLQTLKDAATTLAGDIKRIKDAGAGTVITESIPQSDVYNALYKTALADAKVNVLFFDTYKLIGQIQADPARYGIVNAKDPACKVAPMSSYLCTPALYVTPDANQTYLFADNVNLTAIGQKIVAEAVLSAELAPSTIGQLSYVAQGVGAAQRQAVLNRLASADPVREGAWTIYGSMAIHDLKVDGSAQRTEVDSTNDGATVGADYALTANTLVGGALSWSTLDGDLGAPGGGFQANTTGVGAYLRHVQGPFSAWLEADYGHTHYVDIERRIELGPAILNESGSTSGERFAVATGGSAKLAAGPFSVAPSLGLRYEHGRIAGYAERGDDATQMTFGSQKLETLVASAGVRVSPRDATAALRPYVEVGYSCDLLDRDRQLLVVSNGAPVAWTAAVYTPDPGYLTYGAGVSARVSDHLDVTFGIDGAADRGALSSSTVFIGLNAPF